MTFLRILSALLIIHQAQVAFAQYGGGSGTVSDPYLISTAQDLQNLSATSGDWDKHYQLVNDLDLDLVAYGNPIGNSSTPFIGTFDGNGHTISNLTINLSTTEYVGLFGWVGNKVDPIAIYNLGLIDSKITGDDVVGPLWAGCGVE